MEVGYRKVHVSLKMKIILVTCGSYLMILVYKRQVEDLISENPNRGQERSDFDYKRN